jgi:predicted ATP-dependent serine protease
MSPISKAPCKDCTKRKLNCHGTCEEYKQYQSLLSKIREDKYKSNTYNPELSHKGKKLELHLRSTHVKKSIYGWLS